MKSLNFLLDVGVNEAKMYSSIFPCIFLNPFVTKC